jgi:hypothetical protein
MAMIRKGQIRKIGGRDIRGQAIFITALFDTAASRRSDPVYPRPPIFCDRLCNRAITHTVRLEDVRSTGDQTCWPWHHRIDRDSCAACQAGEAARNGELTRHRPFFGRH